MDGGGEGGRSKEKAELVSWLGIKEKDEQGDNQT